MRGVEEGEKRILVERVRRWMLERYLEDHALEAAGLPELGALEIDSLQKQGLRSAGDVDPGAFSRRPELGVSSFDVTPEVAAALVAWRARVEASFEIDPGQVLGPGDLAELEERLRRRREEWGQALREGAAELKRLRREILARRDERLPALEALQRRLAQLRADLEEVC